MVVNMNPVLQIKREHLQYIDWLLWSCRCRHSETFWWAGGLKMNVIDMSQSIVMNEYTILRRCFEMWNMLLM